ncbi:major facilitator superfamily protein, putative [Ichthyophthirius multifiliis]|uniref:Major facilitator superfamily protein, putative n=1 Tax=Ichthyophthirius multifiliis TaxID=5932 RepID=G0R4C7_ICHMU|nr:major facilitator superfamily protein, putative [Ichthyophthirius multifiliis]EGR27677.1 major facilitator superfamily protein, putative [Ichthyophthirius multifiliis]|eukprot:XP_004025129.1 major facilitator superfamily protein, putative [Ichthyophthirius multifiliis]
MIFLKQKYLIQKYISKCQFFIFYFYLKSQIFIISYFQSLCTFLQYIQYIELQCLYLIKQKIKNIFFYILLYNYYNQQLIIIRKQFILQFYDFYNTYIIKYFFFFLLNLLQYNLLEVKQKYSLQIKKQINKKLNQHKIQIRSNSFNQKKKNEFQKNRIACSQYKICKIKTFKKKALKKQINKGRKLKKPAFQVYNMKHTFISLEQSYEYVGDNSRFQQRITWILSFQWIFYSLLVMGSPMIFRTPKFECKQQANDQFKYCAEETVCYLIDKGLTDYYRTTSFRSISQEFKLYCGDKYLVGIAQSGLFLGFGMNGYECIILVYCTEISARRFRDISVNVLQIMWAFGQFLIPLTNSITDYWRFLYIYCVGLPLVLSIILTYIFFCESPRYYVSKGQYQQAREIFRHISEVNSRPPYQFHFMEELNNYNKVVTKITNFKSPKNNNLQRQNVSFQNQTINQQKQQSTTMLDLFKKKHLIIITLTMSFYWFFRYFTYYCILFSIEQFGNSIKTNYLLLAFIEVFAALISIPLKLRMKRKVALRLSFSIMIFVPLLFFLIRIPKECFIYYGFCFQEFLTIILVIFLKFAIMFFTVNLLTYTSESFPTVLRSQGQGICMIFGQIGSTLAPIYITQYIQIFEQLNPLSFIAFLGMLGWVLSTNLYDNENMQDHIEDEEQIQVPLLKQFQEIQMTVFQRN